MTYDVGSEVRIPEEYQREIKQLDDKLTTARGKRVPRHDLWARIFHLLPMVKDGTWSLRHGRTTVYLVKLDMRQQEL